MTVWDATLTELAWRNRFVPWLVFALSVAFTVACLVGNWPAAVVLWGCAAITWWVGVAGPAASPPALIPVRPLEEPLADPASWLEAVETGELGDALAAWAVHLVDAGVRVPLIGCWVNDKLSCPTCGGDEFSSRWASPRGMVCTSCWAVVMAPALQASGHSYGVQQCACDSCETWQEPEPLWRRVQEAGATSLEVGGGKVETVQRAVWNRLGDGWQSDVEDPEALYARQVERLSRMMMAGLRVPPAVMQSGWR